MTEEAGVDVARWQDRLAPGRYAVADPSDPTILVTIHVHPEGGWRVAAHGPTERVRKLRGRPADWLSQVCELVEADPNAARALFTERIARCQDCGRKLTDPASKARGVGPDCWALRGAS